jgi:hypothetical protein
MPRDAETDYPPLMREQLSALLDYAADHGSGWKDRLRKDWLNPMVHPLLSLLRNSHGPAWLNQFEFPE